MSHPVATACDRLRQQFAELPSPTDTATEARWLAANVAALGLLALLLAPDEPALTTAERLLADLADDAPDRALALLALLVARHLMGGADEAQRLAATTFSRGEAAAGNLNETTARQAVRLGTTARLLTQAAIWREPAAVPPARAAEIETADSSSPAAAAASYCAAVGWLAAALHHPAPATPPDGLAQAAERLLTCAAQLAVAAAPETM